MLDLLGPVATFVLGAVVGSFLNVVIYRLPLGQSVAFPSSRCPRCERPVRARHNVPLVGYLLLGGKCYDCRAAISVRYPLVEFLMGALSTGLWLHLGPSLEFCAAFVFAAGLVAVTFIDLDHGIIPDCLSLGGVVFGFVFSFFTPVGWKASLLGLALGGGSLLAVALGYERLTGREGMGLGDVKLLAAIGAFLGWRAVVFTILVSSIVGSVVGVLAMLVRNSDLRLEVPFGPFLALGALSYVYWGAAAIEWYGGLWV
ncbi:MAG: prepilin peptidase [Deltaproteobacteria bacterium]|nr:prepilin peptidase [Deltaproteobacteria bacterium]